MADCPMHEPRPRHCPLVIAAGGRGRRIGGDKGQRLLAGMSLLDRALRYAGGQSDDVGVAMPAGMVVTLPPRVLRLNDPIAGGTGLSEGPIAALAAAVEFAVTKDADRVAMIGCDMPFLPGDLLDRLGRALDDSGQGAALAVSGGRWHPLAAMWRVLPEELHRYRTAGSRAMMGFAERVGYLTVEWDCVPVDPFFNINTPDDLAQAERQMADFRR